MPRRFNHTDEDGDTFTYDPHDAGDAVAVVSWKTRKGQTKTRAVYLNRDAVAAFRAFLDGAHP